MTVISSYLHNFRIISISHWKRTWPFTWKNESPSSKYTLSQFTWNWPNGYRDFFMIAIFYYLFFLKGHAWPTWIPFTQDALWQVWLKLAKWFWRTWQCVKFSDRCTDGLTDNKKSLLELLSQVSPRATSFTWETIPINLHIFVKLWLYHNVD